ncbi:MAG: epoxyqueuosine reductase QueH, partial [Treponema sp.]|nr:epoxyqueuosine reductase QueH [Treponema sp.]
MSKRTSPYERELDVILSALEGKGVPAKPRLLLHACCAPCSSYVVEYLAGYFDMTLFYYNPNIHPKAEYERRLEELKGFLPRFPVASGVRLVEEAYEPEDFFRATGAREEPVLAHEAEKGERCRRCYEFRMKAAYRYACDNGFDWFTTTLSISPFKDADKINAIGKALEPVSASEERQSGGKAGKPLFLPSDFKKKGGFKRSLELSAEYGLYRQDYCGCVYSLENKKARL